MCPAIHPTRALNFEGAILPTSRKTSVGVWSCPCATWEDCVAVRGRTSEVGNRLAPHQPVCTAPLPLTVGLSGGTSPRPGIQ